MSNINNMKDLREKVLQSIEDLESGKIEIHQAATIAKLSETVISGLKSEMQYALLTNQEPNIPFYGEGTGKILNIKEIKKFPI